MIAQIASSSSDTLRQDGVRKVRMAVAGVGGFAQHHHRAIRRMEREGRAQLVATCDPNIDRLADLKRELDFAGRAVRVEAGFEAMLANGADGLDAVTLPVPIHLHAAMHAACVARGLSCYLEKPPSLDLRELDRMIATDRAAPRPTFVGFHHLANPALHRLKARILAGEFGRLREVAFLGLAQRPRAYYRRNGWAGCLAVGDRMLLDSPFGNAMSHHLMNLLYLAGTRHEWDFAAPVAARSLLLRGNPIEGPDTVFAEVELAGEVRARLALSHACRHPLRQREILVFDEATIVIDPRQQMTISRHAGIPQTEPFSIPPLGLALDLFVRGIGSPASRPPVRLEDCVGFAELNALLYLGAPQIHSVRSSHIEISEETDAMVIHGVDAAAEDFVATGRWPGGGWLGEALLAGCAHRDQLPELGPRIAAWRRPSGHRTSQPAEALAKTP